MTSEEAIKIFNTVWLFGRCDCPKEEIEECLKLAIKALEQEPKTGHCKDCKYFEYDSVAKVDGIPLIVAHEICNKWGEGCKTREDGYCFLFCPNCGAEEEEFDV